MQKSLVTLEIAKIAQEVQFDEECLFYYLLDRESENLAITAQFASLKFNFITNNTAMKTGYDNKGNHLKKLAKLNFVTAPYWSQLTDWLIDKHDLYVEISSGFNPITNKEYYESWIVSDFTDDEISDKPDVYYDYREAREKTILEALNIVKMKQNENKN